MRNDPKVVLLFLHVHADPLLVYIIHKSGCEEKPSKELTAMTPFVSME